MIPPHKNPLFSTNQSKSYGDLYGGGVSKKQLLEHFSEEDLMEIIGIEKMTVYIRKKKLDKIRKK